MEFAHEVVDDFKKKRESLLKIYIESFDSRFSENINSNEILKKVKEEYVWERPYEKTFSTETFHKSVLLYCFEKNVWGLNTKQTRFTDHNLKKIISKMPSLVLEYGTFFTDVLTHSEKVQSFISDLRDKGYIATIEKSISVEPILSISIPPRSIDERF